MDVGERVKILDHGFIELVDVMGSDKRIADAARVSYQGSTGSNQSSVRDHS